MYKEFIIIIIVIISVVGGDIITNRYTKETLKVLKNDLNILREYILDEDKEKSEKQMKKIRQEWEERYKVLAFYIEHDELEKVKTEIVKLESDIEVEEFKNCVSEIETIIFILEHIQEKEEVHLRSIL